MKNYNLTTPMKDQQAWVVKYMAEAHNKDADDVIVCGIPGYKGGGGGLYYKTNEMDKNFNKMKEEVKKNAKEVPDEKDIMKGKFLLVRSDPTKLGEKAVVCFI